MFPLNKNYIIHLRKKIKNSSILHSLAFIKVEKLISICNIFRAIPENYKVLFMQGGCTGMFAAVAMNFLKGNNNIQIFYHLHFTKPGKET